MNASRPEKPNRKLVLSKETVRVLGAPRTALPPSTKQTQGESCAYTPSTKQTQGESCKGG
jgi:hypothetical protein